MKVIKNFMLPEHTNNLYENEAISSISLTKDVADKINELVDSLNKFNSDDLEWKQVLEGKVSKAVLFMKDNLINSLNELMELLLDNGFVDERINYHCGEITKRLDNLLGSVTEGSTSGDAELIDGRTDYTGKAWENIGEHIRYFISLIGSPDMVTREQVAQSYNNLNSRESFSAGDRVYIEPVSINVDPSNIKYITVFGLYGEYSSEGTDTLGYILPEAKRPIIVTCSRDYAGIRITYNFKEPTSSIAYGIVKKLTNDMASKVYEDRFNSFNVRNNNHLFEPVKMRYGAHQGYRSVAPANSLPAYEEACKAGFEWVWIAGCRQSANGTWYIMHDSTVDGTTNGTGNIKEMYDSALDLLSIDVGTNVNKYSAKELHIPKVEEVLKICREYGVNVCFRMMSLYTNATGVDHFRSLIELVKKNGFENAIFSGNAKQIEMLKAFTDNWHGQVYVDSGDPLDVKNMIDNFIYHRWTNCSILATYGATTKELVEYAHANGYKYCVSDIPASLKEEVVKEKLLDMGVDICQSGNIHS